ncbi:Lipase (class 2) [Granulicella pectinivorans]|uniref:Lipase (Class 2) n=1 Tax=Granulicella pectinivorans TaxID=474950 RepID=A0A1I6L2K5_9BACT|nr:alpha/beta fold hydrolase [Granulicella pectinivorans]SFR97667.1 Lipase (class 2) [Granulicella pectinivorans]
MMMRLLAVWLAMAVCAGAQTTPDPIVFVHGNGDDSAKWIGIIGLFESNGFPADRLYAVRFTNPSARTQDHVAEAGRSSTIDQVSELSATVARALLETHAKKVVLVGSSRGGMTIRNYLRNAGGSAVVSAAVLCGTPNHGVFAVGTGLDGEFNGNGDFLRGLNEGSEVVDGVRMMTLRSDKLDKFAQPDGRAAGLFEHTGVTFEGPALQGAENVVIAGADHRELAFTPQAFRLMYRFITGKDAVQDRVTAEAHPVVSGLVTGFAGKNATNLPVSGVRVRVYPLARGSARREGAALYDRTTDASGVWGPVVLDSTVEYEFELEAAGHDVSYFKAPVPRSTALMNLRLVPAAADSARGKGHLLISRPEGYFSAGRDAVTIDGALTKDEPAGLPVKDSFVATVPTKADGVAVRLRGETIWARPSEDFATRLAVVDLLW